MAFSNGSSIVTTNVPDFSTFKTFTLNSETTYSIVKSWLDNNTPLSLVVNGSATIETSSYSTRVIAPTADLTLNSIFYTSDTTKFDSMFSLATAPQAPGRYLLVSNTSGSSIAASTPVKYTGVSAAGVFQVSAATSASASTLGALAGITTTSIANGATGNIASFENGNTVTMSTAGRTVGDKVFITDAGALGFSAGTVTAIVGFVISVGASGTVILTNPYGN